MADKKETVTLLVGATVGAVAVPYVAAKHERMLVPQLPGGLGNLSALLGLGGGAAALYLALKGKAGKHRDLVTGVGLGLLSTGLAVTIRPYISSGLRSGYHPMSGQVRRAIGVPAMAAPSTLVRAAATV